MQLIDWRAKLVMVFLGRFQHKRLTQCLKRVHDRDQPDLDELSRMACRILFAKENEKALARVRSESYGTVTFTDPQTGKRYDFNIGDYHR